jgi:hypothetical protein
MNLANQAGFINIRVTRDGFEGTRIYRTLSQAVEAAADDPFHISTRPLSFIADEMQISKMREVIRHDDKAS